MNDQSGEEEKLRGACRSALEALERDDAAWAAAQLATALGPPDSLGTSTSDDPDILEEMQQNLMERWTCECPRCGRMHHKLAYSPPEAIDQRTSRLVDLLKTGNRQRHAGGCEGCFDSAMEDAAGEIVRLLTELGMFKQQYRQVLQDHASAMDEIKRLRADASTGEDRARLDWLQGRIVDTIYLDDGKIVDVRGENLRKAIDAAMKRWPGPDEEGAEPQIVCCSCGKPGIVNLAPPLCYECMP